MISNSLFLNMLNAPVRSLRGRVEVYKGSTLTLICGCHDSLREFTVERLGAGKFFGYGVCHKINVKLIDRERQISITTENSLEVEFGIDTSYIYPFPRFFVTDVYRDENTNELSITGYDGLYKASNYTYSQLQLNQAYTIGDIAQACGTLLGLPVDTGSISAFNTMFDTGANFDGTESIREVLDAIAEATQTIYYINWDWVLTFKRLSNSAAVALEIDKAKYFSLDSGENRRLGKIAHTTELGDNVSASTSASGSTQYVRENPFWELRNDIGTLISNALAAVGGLTINQFSCDWRGNFLLEIGDRISLTNKDNSKVYSFLLNDTLTFDGSLKQVTEWEFANNDSETESNPVTLGEALKQTYARVDKANKEIELVASEVTENSSNIGKLQVTTANLTASVSNVEEKVDSNTSAITTINSNVAKLELAADNISASVSSIEKNVEDNRQAIDNNADYIASINSNVAELELAAESITASVTRLETNTDSANEAINEEIQAIKQSVETKVTAADVQLQIATELTNGVDKVTTSTGFTFNEDGLTVSKTGSEMTTTITEDGMVVYRDNTEVLTANNLGVDAVNLNATTYLIIGGNSRFETFGSSRTGCFWIGGN